MEKQFVHDIVEGTFYAKPEREDGPALTVVLRRVATNEMVTLALSQKEVDELKAWLASLHKEED